MTLVIPGIECLAPYDAGKPAEAVARELGIPNAIKLASNENPLGPSPRALEAIQRHLSGVHRYPDAAAVVLREALSSRFGVPVSELVQGHGSNELIELVMRTFCTPEHHVVFADPAFVVYRMAAMAQGVPFTAVPLSGQTHDLRAMADAVRPNTRLMYIANPNNPTGTYVSRHDLEQLLRDVPEHVTVVVDEAYAEYADAPDYPNSLTLRGLRERLIVLRTFSKVYGLAALRVGFGVGPAKLIDYMHRVRAPFNVGALGQAAAVAALADVEYVERSCQLNRDQRARLSAALGASGIAVVPSQANFVYVDLGKPARPVFEALLRRGIIVRPFGGLPSALRISVGTPEENSMLIESMKEVLR